MKTLFIEYGYLDGHGGGVYASKTHVNLFAALSEKMTLIYPPKEGGELADIHKDGVELMPVSDHRRNARKFVDLLAGKVHRYSLPASYFDKEEYDIVVFDSSVVSSRLVKRFKRAGIQPITIHHNYQIQYLMGDGSWLTLLPNLFWTWIYEGQAVRNSALNITLTQQDVELLKKHYGRQAPFAVLGVFEYKDSKPAEIPSGERQHRYVITGALGSKQTEDSLVRWIKDFYPVLVHIDPMAQVTIAGGHPSKNLTQIINEAGIRLVDTPEDMAPILQDADYYLCPVDCGGGLKLRNLDGLKYGLPVLTHKVSMRGYEKMEQYGVIFSYETISDFTEGVKRLQSLKLRRDEIQKLYLQQYQFEYGVKRLKEILTRGGIL